MSPQRARSVPSPPQAGLSQDPAFLRTRKSLNSSCAAEPGINAADLILGPVPGSLCRFPAVKPGGNQSPPLPSSAPALTQTDLGERLGALLEVKDESQAPQKLQLIYHHPEERTVERLRDLCRDGADTYIYI